MVNFFSQLWTREEYRLHKDRGEGKPLVHAASSRFIDRGVKPGDMLYVWSFVGGHLFLLGRMPVEEIVPYQRAVARLGASDFSSDLTDHAIARNCTEKRFGREVPLDTIRQLRFQSPDGKVTPPKFRSKDQPDPQKFRGVRKLPASAAMLDRLL
jgi:hypothetical protein